MEAGYFLKILLKRAVKKSYCMINMASPFGRRMVCLSECLLCDVCNFQFGLLGPGYSDFLDD